MNISIPASSNKWDIVAEWLRRWIANPLDFVRACSNHADVVSFVLFCTFVSTGSGDILVVSWYFRPSSGFIMNDQTLTVKILCLFCPDCVQVDNGELLLCHP